MYYVFYAVALLGGIILFISYTNADSTFASTSIGGSSFLYLIGLIFVLLIDASLLFSIIGIFSKKKFGITSAWISVGSGFLYMIFNAAYTIYLWSSIFDGFGYGSSYIPWSGIILGVFISIAVWGTQLVLLLVPASKRNVREVFN